MSAVQGLISNVVSDISSCYNIGAPHQIVMDQSEYEFDRNHYPNRWVRYYE